MTWQSGGKKGTGPTRRSNIYSDNTQGTSKQTHRCRRQKRKQCKQKLICVWDLHVCVYARTREKTTNREPSICPAQMCFDGMWPNETKWREQQRQTEDRSWLKPVCSICVCPSWAGDKGAIEWKRKERADFAQFSSHVCPPASSLTGGRSDKREFGWCVFFPVMRI